MMREFRVYLYGGDHYSVIAGSKKEAMEIAKSALKLPSVVSAVEVLAIINPNQEVFNRSEAAAYLRISTSELADRVDAGKIACSKDGRPLFRKRDLDAYLTRHLINKEAACSA